MNSIKVEPKYNSNINPRIGLIALASDFIIEKDFINIIKDKNIDFFVNRIECYNPLTSQNLLKMSEKVTEVTKDLLPDEKI
ncbi:MAG: racemase, partial [Pelagibacteraceae bacterium]|nr:racemase [Pelagibacteraceae bacterium]